MTLLACYGDTFMHLEHLECSLQPMYPGSYSSQSKIISFDEARRRTTRCVQLAAWSTIFFVFLSCSTRVAHLLRRVLNLFARFEFQSRGGEYERKSPGSA